MTKIGGKKKKKRGNKGTSPGDSPPPISDTLNILRETRDMMDQIHSNGDHSYQTTSSNVNYATNMSASPNIMTNNMCSVNNTPGIVNNTQCVMPQTDDPHQHYMANMTNISSNFNLNNQPGNAHANFPYAAQTPPGGSTFLRERSSCYPICTAGRPGKTSGPYSSKSKTPDATSIHEYYL